MKNQGLFSSKDKSKKISMSSAAIFVWRFKGKYARMRPNFAKLMANSTDPDQTAPIGAV